MNQIQKLIKNHNQLGVELGSFQEFNPCVDPSQGGRKSEEGDAYQRQILNTFQI
jgi:hypothetical protein